MGIGSSEVEEVAAAPASALASAPAAQEAAAPAAPAVSAADLSSLQTRASTLEGQVKNLQDRLSAVEQTIQRKFPYG